MSTTALYHGYRLESVPMLKLHGGNSLARTIYSGYPLLKRMHISFASDFFYCRITGLDLSSPYSFCICNYKFPNEVFNHMAYG